jgi:hypothetical protein
MRDCCGRTVTAEIPLWKAVKKCVGKTSCNEKNGWHTQLDLFMIGVASD